MAKLTVAPAAFWEKFSTELTAQLRTRNDWRQDYENEGPWTQFMRDFLIRLGGEMGFRAVRKLQGVSPEWCKVDIGYFSIDDSPLMLDGIRVPDQVWDWDVAIEHENGSAFDWLDEFIKLLHINCGLRVIIGYNDFSRHSIQQNQLVATTAWKRRRYAQPDQQWLFIFGPTAKGVDAGHDYEAFEFHNGEFSALPKHSILCGGA